MKSTTSFDILSAEFVLNGVPYDVSANFKWEQRAVNYRHDQGRNVGQDMFAEVPTQVAFVVATDEHGEQVKDGEILRQLGEMALDRFADSEQGKRNASWGPWL